MEDNNTIEAGQSSSNTREVEYDFNDSGGKGTETVRRPRWDDSLQVDEKRFITFQPLLPKPQEGVDLKGREVILAIATFFFISVTIGLIVILVTEKAQDQVIYLSCCRKRNICHSSYQPHPPTHVMNYV